MTLRLDSYPEAQIAAQMLPQNPPPATPTLCCLLHTGPLPPSQQVEVWIEGTQQPWQQEGTQQVFSWTCVQNNEMSVHLKQHGRLTKSWRGWWQGETTIAHTGTLQVLVYCAGVLQPAGLPRATAVPVGAAALLEGSNDQQNGSHHNEGTMVATWEAVTAPTRVPPSVSEDPLAEEDDLWEQAGQNALPGIVAEPEAVTSPVHEAWEDMPEQEEAEEEDEEETLQEYPVEVPPPPRMQSSPTEQADPTMLPDAPLVAAPVGTVLASFPATTVWSQTAHQEQEERLTALLATMPANTILVDLRQHTPTPRRGVRSSKGSGLQKLGLSKELLRNQYGGRYWDRGATIQTARRLISTPPPTWGRVVTNPADPDGLGTLVAALVQGFSLMVLDGEPKYAESARAAVLAELHQRIANLTTGSCS
jgi:hypothetical protein